MGRVSVGERSPGRRAIARTGENNHTNTLREES